jgi:F-type H+-transporting ATPase subunit delta
MKGTIAKKYVNALVKSCSEKELLSIGESLSQLTSAFRLARFNNIILSPDVTSEKKCEFVLSLIEKVDVKLTNFIKLLAKNDRLSIIPSISKELKYQISLRNNVFEGEIISNFELSKEQIAKLEENFGKKFNAKIKLNNVVSNYPGIKIELDDLGVEVSFSLNRLKSQMVEHILKTI